jgi:hypothetical protein
LPLKSLQLLIPMTRRRSWHVCWVRDGKLNGAAESHGCPGVETLFGMLNRGWFLPSSSATSFRLAEFGNRRSVSRLTMSSIHELWP